MSALRVTRELTLKLALQPSGGLKAKRGNLQVYVSTAVKIQAAFEDAGIQFIDDDELGGYGARMAKSKESDDSSPTSSPHRAPEGTYPR